MGTPGPEPRFGSVAGAPTSIAAFVGHCSDGPADSPQLIFSRAHYDSLFGGLDGGEMGYAVAGFYDNGGGEAWVVRVSGAPSEDGLALIGDPLAKTGLHALDRSDGFNLLCLPDLRRLTGDAHLAVAVAAASYCRGRRAFLILDLPAGVDTVEAARDWAISGSPGLGSENNSNVAAYWPEPLVPDPLDGQRPRRIAASGIMAGVYASTDRERGVWEAPAGISASMAGVVDLAVRLTDDDQVQINPLGLNALRIIGPYGALPWGARTLQGEDALASDWKYIPVRRTALYVEESLVAGLAFAAFHPNAEPLWSALRSQASAFLSDLWRRGGLSGASARDAYFVRCDSTTVTMADLEAGIVNADIGLALVRPAEFVMLRIQLETWPVHG